MEPNGADAHYRERLLRLPGIGVNYQRPDGNTGMSPALPDTPRVLLPHSLFKLHPDNDAMIACAAASCPDACFLLFREPFDAWNRIVAERLKRAFAEHDIEAGSRLHWLPSMRRTDYLAVNHASSLMLDALHWSGGNTSLDALASGLPILTSRGQFMRGCQSASMMEQINLPDWCVSATLQGLEAAKRLNSQSQLAEARGRIVAAHEQLFGSDAARDDFLGHVERLARDR